MSAQPSTERRLAPRTLPPGAPPDERPRFWSQADCQDVLRRADRITTGGGVTTIAALSTWVGYVRWARNRVSAAGETRNNFVRVLRRIHGARNMPVCTNDVSDAGLETAVRHAEREGWLLLDVMDPQEVVSAELEEQFPVSLEPLTGRAIFSEATYQVDAEARAAAARRLAAIAEDAGMLSAGYVQVSAHSIAMLDTVGHVRYFPFTQAQYSVTVRDPQGTGSGWAGASGWDWAQLDPDVLTRTAVDKCMKSQPPVRVEPGRYTTILEPQAVSDFVGWLVYGGWGMAGYAIDRGPNEGGSGPFQKSPYYTKLGERVVDPRITMGTNPLDPELGYPPFGWYTWGLATDVQAYHPVTWIKEGVLQELSYPRGFKYQRGSVGLPDPGGFRMSVTGPTQTVDEMVQGTKRGLLVTRFAEMQPLDFRSMLVSGYTRDGLWLIEDGKISKPVKNLHFTETILGALNRVEHLGAPVRTFHPMQDGFAGFPQPVIVPALMITDFSFTSLSDAV